MTTPFFEQAKTGRNSWMLYVLTLLVVFLSIQISSIPQVAYLLVSNPSALMTGDLGVLTSTNTGLALTLLSFAGGFFALLLCVTKIHGKRALDIVTGRPRLDWGRVLFGAGAWGILTLLSFAVIFIGSEEGDVVFQFEPLRFAGLLVVSLLFLPFQTTFEELLFRGYLTQGCFLLFRSRWASVILVSILFGAMHLANPEVAAFGIWLTLPQYILMGLILGIISLMDNGLELAIGLHFANNLLAAVTFTSDSSALQTSALFCDMHPTVSAFDTLFMLFAGAAFIALCRWKGYAKNLEGTTSPEN